MIDQCKPTAEQFLSMLGLDVNQSNIEKAETCINTAWCKILEVQSCIERKDLCCSVITQAALLLAKWACSITGQLNCGCNGQEDPTIKSKTSGKFSQTKADDAKGLLSNPDAYNANLLLGGCLNPSSSYNFYSVGEVDGGCKTKSKCGCDGEFR